MSNLIIEQMKREEERRAQFNIGDTIVITQSPKFRGQKAVIVDKNQSMFTVKMTDGSIRKYAMSAVKKDPKILITQLDIKKLEDRIEVLEQEKERYKKLWKRECEAYKDLAIRTGNWNTGNWNNDRK